MLSLLRALAKVVTASLPPSPDRPPANLASMIKQCEAAGKPNLGKKILAQWAKVLDKYPDTKVNWGAATVIGGNSVKKNVFGGKEFIIWFKEATDAEPTDPVSVMEAPKGVPAIAIPKAGETIEDWKDAAKETEAMLKEAGKAFSTTEEFVAYLQKEIKDIQRKIEDYGPNGKKYLLKSGEPHAFAKRVPKWQAQLVAFSNKMTEIEAELGKAATKFGKSASDYKNTPVTTVEFEHKAQDSLADVLNFILDVQDIKKQAQLLDKFKESIKRLEDEKAVANIVTAGAGSFLETLWDRVANFWAKVIAWATNLMKSVDSFTALTQLSGNPEMEAADAKADY